MKKFGKPFGKLAAFKRNLTEQNSAALERSSRLAKRYAEQPERKNCKICEQPLPKNAAFHKSHVPYFFCGNCGHLNGGHEDTAEYADNVYLREDYGSTYRAGTPDEYRLRVNEIYIPKARFLQEALAARKEDISSISVADFGAGSGHFVAALSASGIAAAGFEISQPQVRFAEEMLSGNYPLATISAISPDEIISAGKSQKADVISLIGVLEHMHRPRPFLNAIRDNPHVRYLFLSVPLFSFAVYLETAFPKLAPRVLEGGHTHLFTPQSLIYLEQSRGWTRIAEWWFGLDLFDLMRGIALGLAENPQNEQLSRRFQEDMSSMLDPMQLVVDQNLLCSEVHLLYALPAAIPDSNEA